MGYNWTLTLNRGTIKSMKECPRCKEITNDFAKNKNKKDGLQIYCRSCVKEINADYYKRTPEKNSSRVAATNRMRQEAKEFVCEYLRTHPCVDCGETDIIVLEFDHVRGVKLKPISKMVSNGYGLVAIQKEIDKCEVRCANDHRRATARRGKHFRTLAPVAQ